MPLIPAICNNCHTPFVTDVFRGAGAVTFSGCTLEPCPNCGGKGQIPDGLYAGTEILIDKVINNKIAKESLRKISSILENALKEKRSKEELEEELTAQPEAAFIAQYLPKTSGELAAWVGILVVIILALIGYRASPSVDKQEVENVVNKAIIEHLKQQDKQ